ncbi:hypothetical protein EJ02DRAFT_450237 [Clathrospora elynae]|uniref:Uncharacterized protein n=1 Tax=Clathrospora elynae TaxID=706981 RepID=A0A6A5T3Z3_9PLEO|nr:hypothetical protein EJ02DRAFT_450237 [Clathrospora elynae]
MARLILPLVGLAALCPLVSAGVKFTKPEAGSTLTAGTAIEVDWIEGGDGPELTDLLTYELFLIAGGNKPEDQFVVDVITTQGSFGAGSKSASGMITTASGEDTNVNAYFVKMVAVAKTGGQLTTYSDRFAYSGMKGVGVFPQPVKAALSGITGTAGPATVDNTVDAANPAAGASPAASMFDVEYTMQTGPTRYAPMQPVPPTKITATNTKPLYPTSSVSIATTRLPIPTVIFTTTASQTYSVQSKENTVAPALNPTDDMAKFLRRWQD